MKLLTTIDNIVLEQKFKIQPPIPQEFPSDYLGKGGGFERQKAPNVKTSIKRINTFSNNAVNIIKKYELYKDREYICPAGKLTIGYGTLISKNPQLKGKRINERKATEYLTKFVNSEVVPTINNKVRVPLTQNQYDALVCLLYNIGPPTFSESKLLKMINSQNKNGIIKEWREFQMYKGKVSPGLIRRRKEELDLFFKK